MTYTQQAASDVARMLPGGVDLPTSVINGTIVDMIAALIKQLLSNCGISGPQAGYEYLTKQYGWLGRLLGWQKQHDDQIRQAATFAFFSQRANAIGAGVEAEDFATAVLGLCKAASLGQVKGLYAENQP